MIPPVSSTTSPTRPAAIGMLLLVCSITLSPAPGHPYRSSCGAERGQKKEDKKKEKADEKKAEPFSIRKLTQGIGLHQLGPVSPDGRFLLVIGQKPDRAPNLYRMSLADYTLRPPLTNLKWGVADPAWSPAGDRIAFAGFDETASFSEIYRLDLSDDS